MVGFVSISIQDLRIAVILPALNEALTVGETIRAFHAHLPAAEIWVIDNGSADDTASTSLHTLRETGSLGGVKSETLRGKGNALRKAFREIEADIYVLADADLTYPADSVTALISPILNHGADMVVADRISAGSYNKTQRRMFHGLGNRVVSSLVNFLYRSNLNDVMSGYRVFNRRFVKNYPILVSGFQIETDLSLHALDKRFKVVEVPIRYLDRPQGSESKLNTFADGGRVLSTIARIFRLYKPLAFFGSLSVISMLAALAFGVPVIAEWSISGLVPRIPTALLATAFAIVSLIFFTIALVLDSMAQYDKRSYELKLLGQG